jgi:predicted alpha/beta hydrolase
VLAAITGVARIGERPTAKATEDCAELGEMPTELIRPIDPDSAHAIEETAKATAKAIDAAVQAGKYVGEVLGDLPHDLVGIMGDWVKQRRARRWAELCAETLKILHARGIDNREDVSPSVAIPLIAGAINEDRDVLKELWARLLAAAMDPARSKLVRSITYRNCKANGPVGRSRIGRGE